MNKILPARHLLNTYFSTDASETEVAVKLTTTAKRLQEGDCGAALQQLRDCVLGGDVSPFELQQSGLVEALFAYLTAPHSSKATRYARLRQFLFVRDCSILLQIVECFF